MLLVFASVFVELEAEYCNNPRQPRIKECEGNCLYKMSKARFKPTQKFYCKQKNWWTAKLWRKKKREEEKEKTWNINKERSSQVDRK